MNLGDMILGNHESPTPLKVHFPSLGLQLRPKSPHLVGQHEADSITILPALITSTLPLGAAFVFR